MLEASIPALLTLLVSIVSFSLYLVSFRLYPENKFSLFFWTHLFSYVLFTSMVVVYEFWIDQQHVQALHELVTTITFTNLPFYILEAAITIAGIHLMKQLMSLTTSAVVISFTQVNVLMSALGFYLLGDQTSFNSVIGLIIITIGALIAGMKQLSWNIFKDYNFKLLKFGFLYALLQSGRIVITYLCTAKMNATTHGILQTLTKHLHIIPFAPLTPLHFNIGVQCIIVIALFIYTAYYLDEPLSIINGLRKHYTAIFIIAGLFLIFGFSYYQVFGMIRNKDIIVGFHKLYVPLTAFLGYQIHKEAITKQTKIGIGVIVLGSMYTMFV